MDQGFVEYSSGRYSMHDLIIRGGTVVDGTGAPARVADVAVDGDRITEVGTVEGPAHRVIDATGLLVTPGWVDIHTHYDGQVFWDQDLTPSSWHGVTTVVTGNCGVGFAPVRPEDKDWLIDQMEGVEDIPGEDLRAGMPWNWRSFPEYLDEIEKSPRVMDVAAMLAHGPLRAFVMGSARANAEPTEGEVRQMAKLAREAIEAGAIGISTNRMAGHKGKNGEPAAGTFAEPGELIAIGSALKGAGHRIFLVASDLAVRPDRTPEGAYDWRGTEAELDFMARISKESGQPVCFLAINRPASPNAWRGTIERALERSRDGAWFIVQTSGKPTSIMLGWGADRHLFTNHASFQALLELPWEERLARLRDPEVRRTLLDEEPGEGIPHVQWFLNAMNDGTLFVLGNPPDYEPGPELSVKAIAEREGRPPLEVAYDAMLADDGQGLLYLALDWDDNGTFDSMRELITHPMAIVGLGDGGAHLTAMCDAGMGTFMITHWVKGRTRGERIPLEKAVHVQTQRTAQAFGLYDRGLLAPGYLADINVIDYENLRLEPMEMVYDLPSGGRRFIQGVSGYRATVKSGQLVRENDKSTGVRPGGLVRGPQPAPPAPTA
ncbi:amidohydrolase family protein [Streptomyces sp. NPDC051985]|uniref:N-acyl-D-amino-acid deacylase family protein n=1 Tax=Streptomyces sp. NPDC051985 TaxID=3155807 RepID=UPI00342B1384